MSRFVEAGSDIVAGASIAPIDWRLAIPEARRRTLRIWFLSIAATTFAVVVVGGITRLTLSGLSIVEWNPIMGVIPPLTDADWRRAFDSYRQFPEYLTWRGDMTLAEFRTIYLWEYVHRLLARAIGLVFLVPFVFFAVRRWLTRPLLVRALLLFGLGALQGLMGWLMVASGLVDRPSVSHYRLAAHLVLAFTIFGAALWFARDLAVPSAGSGVGTTAGRGRLLLRGLAITGTLLGVQIVWGAFTAGLKAGRYYPTFPLMGGRLVPAELLWLDSAAANFVANPIAVQWTHRVLGTLLLIATLGLFTRVRRSSARGEVNRRYAAMFASGVAAQYGLGILTLVLHVPVALGVLHQAVALILLAIWLVWLHHVLVDRAGEPVAA